MTTLLHSSKRLFRFGLTLFTMTAMVFVFGQCPPPTPTANAVTINCGATATLSATGSPNYIWYSDAAGTNMVGTGASYTTPALTSNTTMYLRGAAGAAQAGTQTYNINSYNQLVNVPNNCCGGSSSYYQCGGSIGFNWNDNLAAGTQIATVQVQISVGVNCHSGQALTPQLNNNNGTPFTPAYHCNCCGSNNNIFTFNFQPNQYVVGGVNQFRIPTSTCLGFFNGNGSLSGLYARVTVTYQNIPCTSTVVAVPITVNPLPSPTANPVTINCGNTATLTASGSAGTYVWYSDAAATQQVATGASFTTPALVAGTTYYVRTTSGQAGCNAASLANILSSLNANAGVISAAVPNGYNFNMDGPNGLNSTYISDGGNDMYDGGNYIGTNLGNNLTYSDNAIANSNIFGAGGQYFTRKINNMWVLVANVNNISSFHITGNNGADGGGSLNGTILNITVGCQQYRVLLKRVWSTSDPSINQMVILPGNANATHSWPGSTDNTQHDITGLAGSTRLYYLLYASASGGYIDDNTATNIATTFLTQVAATSAGQGACLSNIVAVPVTVNSNVSQPVITGTTTVNCGATTSLTSSSGNNTAWYSAAAGGNLLGTGSPFTTPSLGAATTFYAVQANMNQGSQTFNFTGAQQTWTVPAGVTSINVDVQGAQGGQTSYGTAGRGGRTQATIPVSPGATIIINVGGQGNYSTGGWNGGGNPYGCGCVGGGGGASDIRIGGNALANRAIVAGGGGGAGYYWNWNNDHGGNGGGLTGEAGKTNNNYNATYCGQGGTQASGGNGASQGGPAGTIGTGGGSAYYAGSGGGGYYGGGSGYAGGGGGGGSSYTNNQATGVTHTQGFKTGNGIVTISWNSVGCASQPVAVPITVNSLGAPSAANATVGCGTTAALTATGGGGNSYTWYTNANGTGAVANTANFTTPSLSANTTYYVASTSGLAAGTAYTFTNCAATGMYGPTQAQVNSSYAGTNLAGSVTSQNGIQVWTVPASGIYRIEAFGAQGGGQGNFGRGAQIRGDFNLTAGQQLKILVGQSGGVSSSGSGGGGSFVTDNANVALLVAGGGGGQYTSGSSLHNAHAVTTNNGQATGCSSGGVSGAGGAGCNSSGASGGGGLNSNGTNGSYGTGGMAFVNGGNGGNHGSSAICVGGFGGGGGTHGNTGGGGGGGGYSGGAGGWHDNNTGNGGGGGSYNTGTNQSNTGGVRVGDGLVTITAMTSPCVSPLTPVTVTVNALTAPTANNVTINCGQTASLTASNNLGAINWYSNANGSTLLSAGASFTTPQLNATTTYYVGAGTGACATAINPVVVTVNALASPTVANASVNINCGQTTVLSASNGGGATYTWYSNAAGSTIVGTGASFTTPALTANMTYYVASTTGVGGGNTFTFTNCSATGQFGPTQAQINSAYAGTSLANAVTSSNGIQLWTVPTSGNYRIEAFGAQGGGNNQFGRGSQIRGDFALTAGQQLKIIVGQQGGLYGSGSGSGGGGSFVATSANVPLIVAGGGGGQYDGSSALYNAHSVITNNGQGTGCSSGGVAGAGGSGCNNSGAAGGGGFNTNGTSGSYGTGGAAFVNGGNGGNHGSNAICVGGFGGGGGTHGNTGGGGGGGGYSGGAGGFHNGSTGSGGGGGSYNNGTNQVNTGGVRTGHGEVIITSLSTPCASNLIPVAVSVNLPASPSAAVPAAVNCGQTAVLNASGGGGNTFYWYSNANGSTQVGTGASFTTPALSGSTTYYVSSGTSQAGSQTFNYTGAVQTFTAPAAGTYTLDVYGARGGNVTSYYPTNGGLGGRSQGTITLTAGQVVYVYVGGQGADRLGNHPYGGCTFTAGGWNGGGANRSAGNGTPGGGASDLRVGGQGLANRVIVAGGGGGCGWTYAAGGSGGGLTGGAGTNHGSGGATQAAGGAVGGSSGGCGQTAGTLGVGGDGSGSSAGGGGGGGGYYGGGGGGYNQGGGGGSSYIGGVTNGTTTAGVRNGDGQVIISWSGSGCQSQLVPVAVAVNGPAAPVASNAVVNCGAPTTLNATNGGGQIYTWYSDAQGTQQISTGASYTTPALSSTTTYYVNSGSAMAAAATFTFSNAGASGSFGPTQAQLNSAYSGTNLAGAVTSSSGIQVWTVPTTGVYTIDARGARGGTYPGRNSGGNGARMVGTFNLTAGQQIKILVGQEGYYGGGGGGSFVATSANVPLIVSGGGGGGGSACGGNPPHAGTATNGSNNGPCYGYTTYNGGTNGSGGNGPGSNGGPGGGFNTNGTPGDGNAGTAFVNGGNGGASGTYYGGFGGGGGSTDDQGAGGGGYSGGAGDTEDGDGGGGGSYNAGTNQSNTAGFQAGMGQVIITQMTTPCVSNLTPVTVTVNAIAAPVVAGNTTLCANGAANTTLTASGSPSGYAWYANANGTGALGSNAAYTTPNLNATTTYYVQSATPQGGSQTFNYTGGIQSFTAPVAGTYTLEAWGAQGGGGANCYGQGGAGGYSKGNVSLNAGQTIYIGVGQAGFKSASATAYNGGGAGNPNGGDPGYTGGGATHISTASGTLSSFSGNQNAVLIVAGGGGGAAGGTCVCQYQGTGGAGGGTTGVSGTCSANDCGYRPAGSGGTQNAGGTSQSASVASGFGVGASSSSSTGDCIQGGGGGGGWYGGGAGGHAGGGGGGGSGYVAAALTVTQVTAGNASMPNPAGGNMTGRLGDGIAKITWSGTGCVSSLTPVTVTVNAIPAAPSANAASICTGQTATLNASANANWYTVPSGGASIGQAQAYTTPSLNNTITYYMEGVNGPCVSATRTPVTVTVNAGPATNAGTSIVDPSTCGKNTVNVGGNALAAGQSGQWTVLSAANNAGIPGTFSMATSANDVFTGHYGATYVLQWQITNQSNGCVGTDTMVVTFNQPSDASIAGLITTNDLLWCGLTGTNWSTSTNWYQKQAAGHYIRMSGAVQPAINNEVFTVSIANAGFCVGTNNPTLTVASNSEDVYVGPGITWNLSNDSINIAENLVNNGTIIAATGVVNFTGSNNSTI
ncbi:MAG: hypothetical protein K9I97_01585, partial [Cryomorphaceae bacterium]|nr:hypothetical protein [Cryomorphaceae bacterium]